MLKFLLPVATTALLFTLSSCGQTNEPWLSLQTGNDATYELALKTFEDPDTIAQPFELGIRSSAKEGEFRSILFAEHCRNVAIAQQKESLFIFYDEVGLTHFSAGEGGGPNVTLLMCDNGNAECGRLRTEKVKQGASFVSVCTLP